MAFRHIGVDLMLKGTILAILDQLFPEGAPTLKEFAADSAVAPSTFRRSAQWIIGSLLALLESHRPGPTGAQEAREADVRSARQQATRKLQDLSSWLRRNLRETEKNTCFSPQAKLRIAVLAEEICSSSVMTFAEVAAGLGIDVRQLHRIRTEVRRSGGEAPEEKSRRPEQTGDLAPEIQRLIARIEASADSRTPYGPIDIRRILQKKYEAELLEHHGRRTISASTVAKYMTGDKASSSKPPRQHPRGSYRYPEPFQQVAIDTSHFKLFGIKFYFITVLEMGGRLHLLTRVFLREKTAEVVSVIAEYLERYPGVEAMVMDRGTPYLNEEVKALLERHGRLRLVCPPATPTAKAACERHFRTLKVVIRKAVQVVFACRPALGATEIATALELGVAVFQELYHQIPQEGIDGKSPAERIESFDPVRASRALVELFECSLDWEPAEDYAKWIHARFQLPGEERETVRRLRRFGTRVLRRMVEEVSPYLGPPFPEWLKDPLGFLAAKAHQTWARAQLAARESAYAEAKAKSEREDDARREKELEAEARQSREHPECFLDPVLATLLRCAASGFEVGLRISARNLRELLTPLSRRLGAAFSAEIRRIRERIRSLTTDARALKLASEVLENIERELAPAPEPAMA
ncbi:MAG: hypothetical protein ACE5EF_08175 [Dehalococcoidia bacterium]